MTLIAKRRPEQISLSAKGVTRNDFVFRDKLCISRAWSLVQDISRHLC